MSIPDVVCKKEQRRNQIRDEKINKKGLNGLDYLEVSDDQLILTVFFLGKAPLELKKENIHIEGGRRITGIKVTNVETHQNEDPETDDCVHITVDKFGDFSTYRLCLIENYSDENGKKQTRILTGIDPRYACLDFSFKTDCPSDLDCKASPACPPEKRPEPEINYLAKDYASFRQLILDRMALTIPDWKEQHVPDLGIALVELLAYAGDQLSYYQDAVATEAYLDTARRRISVRRHARLVDYQLHEGCNARTWVVFQVSEKIELKPKDFYLITDPNIPTLGKLLTPEQLPKTLPKPYLIFEPLVENPEQKVAFYESHNEINIYTWGDTECCLPKGTTSATLIDPAIATTPPKTEDLDDCCEPCHPDENQISSSLDSNYKLQLKPGDILIFEEIKGSKTGNLADADPNHRHAVCLIKAEKSQDILTGQLIWEIEWTAEDALPFALCISSLNKEDCSAISDVSVVRGNVLLVDHGETVEDKESFQVPLKTTLTGCSDDCTPRETIKIADRFEPTLSKSDLTFRQPLEFCESKHHTPANMLLKQDVHLALPEIKLFGFPFTDSIKPDEMQAFQFENLDNLEALAKSLLDKSKQSLYLLSLFSQTTQKLLSEFDPSKPISSGLQQALINELNELLWRPRLDLLGSDPNDRHFVVEVEEDRRAKLRFGDGDLGRFPEAETQFKAQYRIGNGSIGNVGHDSITHLVLKNQVLTGVTITPRNPLPATGGTHPEPLAEAKLFAPQVFRKELQRAITADDYAQIVMHKFGNKVQRAAAKLRWTGSWFEVLVAIDPFGSEETDEELLEEIKQHLYRYHRIGHDVVVVQASYVALDIAMTVCVLPHYLRGHVKSALLDVFSSRTRLDGSKGFFHPDNLTFGEGIYLSKLVATAQAVEGVESVIVTKLERFFVGNHQEIANGLLPLGDFEIARLDNDPSFPENGKFTLDMRGGR